MLKLQLRSILTLLLCATGLVAGAPALAAPVTQLDQTVGFVYQLDDAESFDFQIPGLVSSCGSDYYRVRSTSAPVLSRKFALVMSAFLADRRLTFQHDDVGSCEGSRKLVGWIRLVA
jgi:hypothetical protein